MHGHAHMYTVYSTHIIYNIIHTEIHTRTHNIYYCTHTEIHTPTHIRTHTRHTELTGRECVEVRLCSNNTCIIIIFYVHTST